MKRSRGFSLIDLPAAIILIMVASGVPNLLRPTLSTNEASALSSIRSINTAEVYQTAYPNNVYTQLGQANPCGLSLNACLIDNPPLVTRRVDTASMFWRPLWRGHDHQGGVPVLFD